MLWCECIWAFPDDVFFVHVDVEVLLCSQLYVNMKIFTRKAKQRLASIHRKATKLKAPGLASLIRIDLVL